MKENPMESNSGSTTASRMGRSSEEWRQDIETRKEAIAGTIRQIDRRVHRVSDWRVQVGEHPFLAVGVAFAAGGLLSGFFRRHPTPQERIIDAIADSVEDITGTVRDHVVGRFTSGMTRNVIKTIGLALVTKAASAYVSRNVNDELDEFGDQEN